MIDVVMPTYARTPVSFERGEVRICTRRTGDASWISGPVSRSAYSAGPQPSCAGEGRGTRPQLWHVSNLYEVPEQKRWRRKLADSFRVHCSSAIRVRRRWRAPSRRRGSIIPQTVRRSVIASSRSRRVLARTAGHGGSGRAGEGSAAGFGRGTVANPGAVRRPPPLPGLHRAGGLWHPGGADPGRRRCPRVAEHAFLKAAEAVDDAGILLLMDEVQCGMGRTGKLFGARWGRTSPTSWASPGYWRRFRLIAFTATAEAAKGMVAGSHGTTYGGNPDGHGRQCRRRHGTGRVSWSMRRSPIRMKQGWHPSATVSPTVFKGVRVPA